uniref:ATP synthase complex subunit 8 n=1 Tax=Rhipidia chenwenyoungi TaxID=1807360 RepID=A0A191F7S2_9DIPT|nr:ATP synthase F0 subunit 8 [Rhipidia chenwenyoungi]
MPQMAPLMWLSMFIIFSITLIIFNTMNYFTFFPIKSKSSNLKINSKNTTLNWKW